MWQFIFLFFKPADVNRKCWYVTTKGMHAVGQAEVVILLQCLPDEKTIPKDIFTHFVQLYQEALNGEKTTNQQLHQEPHCKSSSPARWGPLGGWRGGYQLISSSVSRSTGESTCLSPALAR